MEGEELREILDALSERTRYAILESLSKRPMTGDEIAESVGRSRSTIESHLSILLRLGLISRKRDEKRYLYEIAPKAEAWLNREVPQTEVKTHKRHNKFSWWILSLALSFAYFSFNSFILPFPIWLFALFFGIFSVYSCKTLRELLLSIMAASLILSILPFLLVFQPYSLLDLLLSFILSLAFLAIISSPVWYLAKRVLDYMGLHI